MNQTTSRFRIVVVLLLAWAACDRHSIAADIQAGLSGRETYVGLPVVLQIRIANATKYEPPTIPEVDGLSIRSTGVPAQSSQVTIINGRRSESTSITYSYRITPQREGNFTIPPIKIKADGAIEVTKAMRLSVTKSETGDLMFVEVNGKQDSIYVGQALDLTLKIWLRPYRDEQRQVVLSEGDMWNLISSETSWGPFAERIEELAKNNKRPGGEEVLREDTEAKKRSYYLYEIDATIYPQRAGNIDTQDIQVIVQYPTALDKSRDPFASFFNDDRFPFRSDLFGDDLFSSRFGRRLRIKSIRPITAEATVDSISVKPIPTDQRPADYRGAVGKYQIATEAKPTKVTAGDPITLHIGVSGDGPMDRIQAPPLAELGNLSADFKVPDQQLAGFVDRTEKVFSTSIRPKRAGITEIPAIPFSYFDPESEKFVTVYSEPIAIEVGQAETLALDAIVGSDQPRRTTDRQIASPAESLVSFENFTGEQLLISSESTNQIRRFFPFLLAGPPVLAFFVYLLSRRTGITQMARRVRSPRRELEGSIAQAETAEDVASALISFAQRRLRLQTESDNRSAAVGILRAEGHRELANELERILNDCQSFSFTTEESRRTELGNRALEFAKRLDQQVGSKPWSRIAKSKVRQVGSISSTVIVMIAFTCESTLAEESLRPASVARQQQRLMLSEANELYRQGLDAESEQPAKTESLARRAAEKYQWVIDSGISNPQLYFNLANAYLKSGQTGRAIANYHRAIRLAPANRRYHQNLQFAQSTLPTSNSDADQMSADLPTRLKVWTDLALQRVSATSMGITALACWCMVWGSIALRLLRFQFPWKSLVALALTIFVFTGGMFAYWVNKNLAEHAAIVVARVVDLRAGDGDNFPQVVEIDNSEGMMVRVLHRRGQWAQVRTKSGRTGWLRLEQLEII